MASGEQMSLPGTPGRECWHSAAVPGSGCSTRPPPRTPGRGDAFSSPTSPGRLQSPAASPCIPLLQEEVSQGRGRLCPRASGSDKPSLEQRGLTPRAAGRGDSAQCPCWPPSPRGLGTLPRGASGCPWEEHTPHPAPPASTAGPRAQELRVGTVARALLKVT